ncbi:MAG: hypothetical protein M1819_001663 [Sarea resinae]|nr:MAG: hypothetical protein M1819_001663 [Sarea resinae]
MAIAHPGSLFVADKRRTIRRQQKARPAQGVTAKGPETSLVQDAPNVEQLRNLRAEFYSKTPQERTKTTTKTTSNANSSMPYISESRSLVRSCGSGGSGGSLADDYQPVQGLVEHTEELDTFKTISSKCHLGPNHARLWRGRRRGLEQDGDKITPETLRRSPKATIQPTTTQVNCILIGQRDAFADEVHTGALHYGNQRQLKLGHLYEEVIRQHTLEHRQQGPVRLRPGMVLELVDRALAYSLCSSDQLILALQNCEPHRNQIYLEGS